MDRLELQKLRDLPIEGVAERLGMQVVRHKALCPFHDDHHASLSFSVRRNTFRCFACDAHGGTIDLVMKQMNMDFKEAIKWLGTENNVIVESGPLPARPVGALSKRSGERTSPEGERMFDASRYERFFERPFLNVEARRFLYDERRIDPRVVRWCRLTSWKDKRQVSWLQIPYYDREGCLVGIQNRNLNPSKSSDGDLPRFRFPQGSQCGIYNLPVLNLLRPGDELWITEGCSDCWAMLSSGRKAIAIPSATLLTKKDKEQLSALSSPRGGREGPAFHMYPDRDAPGERLFMQLQKVLPGLVHHQLPEGCKDFGEYWTHPHPRPHPSLDPKGRFHSEAGKEPLSKGRGEL